MHGAYIEGMPGVTPAIPPNWSAALDRLIAEVRAESGCCGGVTPFRDREVREQMAHFADEAGVCSLTTARVK